jgi:hypothetical protein
MFEQALFLKQRNNVFLKESCWRKHHWNEMVTRCSCSCLVSNKGVGQLRVAKGAESLCVCCAAWSEGVQNHFAFCGDRFDGVQSPDLRLCWFEECGKHGGTRSCGTTTKSLVESLMLSKECVACYWSRELAFRLTPEFLFIASPWVHKLEEEGQRGVHTCSREASEGGIRYPHKFCKSAARRLPWTQKLPYKFCEALQGLMRFPRLSKK